MLLGLGQETEEARAVKILENVDLVLASKFENFRELPSKDS